jgi:hypothetical protein
MKVIMFVIIITVLVISHFATQWLINYINDGGKNKNPKELDELEKEVVEKTDSYKEVVERVEETEKKIKKIKTKSNVKK